MSSSASKPPHQQLDSNMLCLEMVALSSIALVSTHPFVQNHPMLLPYTSWQQHYT